MDMATEKKGGHMNELNFGSSEASKRLVEAGIVLKTDFLWGCMYIINGKQEWYIREDRDDFIPGMPNYPAPSIKK